MRFEATVLIMDGTPDISGEVVRTAIVPETPLPVEIEFDGNVVGTAKLTKTGNNVVADIEIEGALMQSVQFFEASYAVIGGVYINRDGMNVDIEIRRIGIVYNSSTMDKRLTKLKKIT